MALTIEETLLGSFTGHNGAGAITLTGAKVGDVLVVIRNTSATSPGDYREFFEKTISVADQVQQTSTSDYSSITFDVVLVRPVTTAVVVTES
jgi:hypothetical protein